MLPFTFSKQEKILSGRRPRDSEAWRQDVRLTRRYREFILVACILVLVSLPSQAQTIRVDAKPEHAANSIIPTRALGAGIDRLP